VQLQYSGATPAQARGLTLARCAEAQPCQQVIERTGYRKPRPDYGDVGLSWLSGGVVDLYSGNGAFALAMQHRHVPETRPRPLALRSAAGGVFGAAPDKTGVFGAALFNTTMTFGSAFSSGRRLWCRA
jgi:hypothetical protein